MIRDEYDIHMTNNFGDDWLDQTAADKDKLWQTTLETWNDIAKNENAEGLMSLAILGGMEPAERLLYRTALAEEGQEFTPLQVDLLCQSINYTFSLYDEQNPVEGYEDEEGDF